MRSDREEIPEGYTKEQADEAEMVEARLQQRARTSRAAPGCEAYWPVQFEVCGAIRDKYNSLGKQWGFLSFPTSGEQTSPDGHGKFTTFVNGPIYWSAAGGAHPVLNSFLNRWGVHQYEMGWLGYPISDEIVHTDGVGRRQEFQNGAIYVALTNAIGSAIKNGPIRDKWNTVGAETPGSLLGYPIGDEIPLPDGQGRMARFARGVIYWSPTAGAHPVTGTILAQWSAAGYEQSEYRYPTGDAAAGSEPGSTTQAFQTGSIYVNGGYFRGVLVPAGAELPRDFQPNEVTGHPPYPAVDLSAYGVLGGTQAGVIAGNGNKADAALVQEWFDFKGYSQASAMWDHFYDNVGTNYLISTPTVNSALAAPTTNYANLQSGGQVLAENREDAVQRAIAAADSENKTVKVIVSTGWRVIGAGADEPNFIFSLGRFSMSTTTSVIASPGSAGQHQIKFQQGKSLYDHYDFAYNDDEYPGMQQGAVNTGALGTQYGVAKPYLVYGDGTVESGTGVR